MSDILRQLTANLIPTVSGGAYQDAREVSIVWNTRRKHRFLPEFRCRMHQTRPSTLFSPVFSLAREKIGPPAARQKRPRRNEPPQAASLILCARFFLSKPQTEFAVWVLSQICDNLSVSFADSIPTPFVPSGHFPLIGGIGPWKGSLWCVQNNKIQCKKVQSDKSRLHLLLTANIQRQLLANSIPPYQARAAGGASETTTTERAAASDVSYPLCSFLPFQTAN